MRAPTQVWFITPVLWDIDSFLRLRTRLIPLVGGIPELAGTRPCFVVIDDSAGLDQAATGLGIFSDTTVIRPPFNLGHQRALVYGLRTMSSRIREDDIVVTLDADGEDQPEDLPRLLTPLIGEDNHRRRLVVAWRTKRHESLSFKILYKIFRLLFRTATGTVINSGNYAAYRGWVVRNVLSHPYFDLCYSSSLVTLGMDLHYVPCSRGVRYAGRSRMNYFRLIMHGFRMLMPFLDRIAVRALVVFSLIFALALVGTLAVLGVRLFTDLAVPGWATYTLLLIFIASLMAVANALILFAVFVQSHGLLLRGLEWLDDAATREASHRPS